MAFFSKSRLCICNRIVNLKVSNASTEICQYCYLSITFICARDYLFPKTRKSLLKLTFIPYGDSNYLTGRVNHGVV